jgi:hypothetical protein
MGKRPGRLSAALPSQRLGKTWGGAEPKLERGGPVDERRGEADASRTEAQSTATEQAGPEAGAELGPLFDGLFHTS